MNSSWKLDPMRGMFLDHAEPDAAWLNEMAVYHFCSVPMAAEPFRATAALEAEGAVQLIASGHGSEGGYRNLGQGWRSHNDHAEVCSAHCQLWKKLKNFNCYNHIR
ncbi:hypothetical protein [Paenibacillus agricola]|uniref:Uncharacterized protein n=1 Tax=Paenibacillus agricola TaxID=2716264 RepID=A0ABX0JDZ3_9BACL|nr:hypothetical protein [Paenibacillus agricola]NHN31920.1 hypothetical protein [Paenibacillus agricola]